MFGALVFLFTVVPAMEIYLLFQIGGQIGGLNTMAIVILTGVVGAALAKAQGFAVLNQIQGELNRGQIPAKSITHGLLVFGGGLLLLTPGFMTDILGLCMVIPGTRHIIAAWMKNMFERSVANGNTQFYFFSQGTSFGRGPFQGQDPFQRQNPFEQTQRHEGPREVSPGTFEAEFTKKQD